MKANKSLAEDSGLVWKDCTESELWRWLVSVSAIRTNAVSASLSLRGVGGGDVL